MKRRLHNICISCVTLCLGLLILVGSALSANATDSTQNALDFGIDGMESNQTLSASALFEKLFGEAPTEVERTYLDELSGLSMTYNNAVPDSIVSTSYHAENGTLDVFLTPYRFVASNGVTVEWIPQKATIGTSVQSFSETDGTYSCRFEGLFHSSDFHMEIDFLWNAEIPAESVDLLLTSPYAQAEIALRELEDYEAKLAAYQAEKARFLAYEAYIQSVEAYRQYTEVDLPAYEAAMNEYSAYREKYEAYTANLAAYEAWQQYWAYQEFMTGDVQQKYQAYQAYLKELAPVQARLNILESLFINDSHGWQLYSSLMGDTVTQVVDRKDELVSVLGKSAESYIDNAGAATTALRALLKPYAELRAAEYPSEHARLTALYQYYTVNYAALREQFDKLYNALFYLGNKSAVIVALQEKGKMEHFFQFVGQLYVTQACMDDAESLDTNWWIYHADFSLENCVDAIQRLTDAVSNPTGVNMPANEVPKVEKVEKIDRPAVAEVRDCPTPPSPVVTEPQKPEAVAKPNTENPPEEATDPGDFDETLSLDSALLALAEALRNGTLPEREASGHSQALAFGKTVSVPVSIRNLKTVTFYAADGVTVLDRQTLEYGSRIVYNGPDTARAPDEKSYYQFLSWVLPDGSSPELVAVGNLSLYAKYKIIPRAYTVTWILDGVTRTTSHQYGEMPVYLWGTQKGSDKAYTYLFSGWDKEVTPVTEDVTYTASFLPVLRSYTVTWIVDGKTEVQVLPYGTLPDYTGEVGKAPDNFRYDFIGWDKALVSVSEDITYTAKYKATALAFDNSGKQASVSHTDNTVMVYAEDLRVDIWEAARYAQETGRVLEIRWERFSLTLQEDGLQAFFNSYCREIGIGGVQAEQNSTVYTVGYFNSIGVQVHCTVPSVLKILCNAEGLPLAGYLKQADGWDKITQNEADITGAATVRICDVYALKVTSSEPCNTVRFPRYAEAETSIDLSLIGFEFGYEIGQAALLFADGRREVIAGTAFLMPSEAVEIELTISKIIYRVSFVANGKVIHTAEYEMGEEIQLPENPVKESDEIYEYIFSGWSPDVDTIAFGDNRELVYEAVFSAKLLNPVAVTPNKSLFRTVLWVAVGALFGLIGIAVFIIFAVRRKKKAGRNGKAKAAKASRRSAKSATGTHREKR